MKLIFQNFMKKIIMAMISVILGVSLFHYTEGIEYSFVMKLRDLIYFQTDRYSTDDNGIRANRYKGLNKEVYNPVTVAQTVLQQAECVLSNEIKPPAMFHQCEFLTVEDNKIINVANWFLSYGKSQSFAGREYVIFPYNFDYPKYRIKKPWISGMAQGQAIEVLLAAYLLTHDKRYFSVAEKAANTYKIKRQNGGVLVVVNGGSWFEEYASKFSDKSPLVLNGHMFAMDALFWLRHFNPKWNELYMSGVHAVEKNISKYQSAFWSKYDLDGNLANGKYHRIHIAQLERIVDSNEGLALPNIEKYINEFKTDLLFPLGGFERLYKTTNRYLVFVTSIYSFLIYIIFFTLLKAIGSTRDKK